MMLLFDIDGTLLRTGGAGRVAFEKAFSDLFGLRDVWQDLAPDGKTDPLIIEELTDRALGRRLAAAEYARLVERYLFHFKTEVERIPGFRLLPGVAALLEHLSGRDDFLVGIGTGNFEEAAWGKLERGGIRRYFRFGGFGSDDTDRVEILKKAVQRGKALAGESGFSVVVIGDAPQDILAARKIGARAVAVGTGRRKTGELRAFSPDAILPDLEGIPRFLGALGLAVS